MPTDRNSASTIPSIEPLEPRRMLAGDFAFALKFGHAEDLDAANSLATDQAGNVYIAGTFRARMDMDPSKRRTSFVKSRGNADDIFVAKYTPAGKLLWARSFGGPGNDAATILKIGPSGDVYLSGTFTKTADFGIGKSTILLTSNGDGDAFIARLSAANGRALFAGSIGGIRDDFITAMDIGPDGDIYIAGTVRTAGDLDPSSRVHQIKTIGVDDTFISRLDGADGSLKWTRVYGENDTREGVAGLTVDSAGGVHVAGTFRNTVRFDRQRPAFDRESNGADDIYFARLTPTGAWDFIKTAGGRKDDRVAAMVRSPNNDLIVTGSFIKQVDFDFSSGRNVLTAKGDVDGFVIRYRANGDLAWASQFGGRDGFVRPNALALDADGSIYAAGSFLETVDFDPGRGVTNLLAEKRRRAPIILSEGAATDGFIVKLSAGGSLIYARQIGGEEGSVAPHGIGAGRNGDVYVTGAFGGLVDLNPGKALARGRTAKNRGDTDVFLLKLID